MKNFCLTHHFSYNGTVCPFCQKEQMNNIVNKFARKKVCSKKEIIDNGIEREITKEDLKKLVDKFSKK